MSARVSSASLAVMVLLGSASLAPGDDKGKSDPAAKTSRDDAARKSAAPSAASPSAEAKPGAATKRKTERATFGAGCFWHVEDIFEHVKGVKSAISGYAGGNVPFPSYEMVHTGLTGHAEVVQVEFDPEVVTYEQLLKVFWACHDPTSINKQGEDEGPQYRSVILFHNFEQKEAALKSYEELTQAGVYARPIVTQLVPMRAFFRAEDYHQDYYGGKRRAVVRRHRTLIPKTAKATSKTTPKARGAKSRPAPSRVTSSPRGQAPTSPGPSSEP
jgi:peptide-methionine (S)-S-oxide reductase